MKIKQILLKDIRRPDIQDEGAHLVLVFAETSLIRQARLFDELRFTYPNAIILGCSTSGEIYDTKVYDNTISLTAIHFENTRIHLAFADISNNDQIGADLAKDLLQPDLRHVLVLADGVEIDGAKLVSDLHMHFGETLSITGGLAGDADRFKETWVIANGPARKGVVAALGFYGTRLNIGFGSLGGWDSFGPERIITKAKGNSLYDLDGQSALKLYKTYLGPHAEGLPSTGLLFPLTIKTSPDDPGRVRTILAVDEEKDCITFAGDMPEGAIVQLMRANFERLIDGAAGAAKISNKSIKGNDSELAILISCVGRKLVLKQRVEEEVESVREMLGKSTVLTGFYSYGEICPSNPSISRCEFHNQTMTITTLKEV